MAVNIELLPSNSVNNIDTNFDRVEAALQDVIGRSGDTPNQMESDLDMNNYDLLNVKTLQVTDLTIDGEDPTGILELALQAVEDAEAQVSLAEDQAILAQASASEAVISAASAEESSEESAISAGEAEASALAAEAALASIVIGLPRARVMADSNITLAAPGSTIDGVTMVVNDVFLAIGQSDSEYNGLYIWNGAATPATRSLNYDTFDKIAGQYFSVTEGSVYADTLWNCTSDFGGTIDVSPLTFVEFSGVSSADLVTFDNTNSNLPNNPSNVQDAIDEIVSVSTDPRVSFSATMSTSPSIATSGSYTVLPFNTESWDEGSFFDVSTYRWTPPAGRYLINNYITTSTGTASGVSVNIAVRKNGSAILESSRPVVGAGVQQTFSISGFVEANGTDYFDFCVAHSSAGNYTVLGAQYSIFSGAQF